MFIFAGILMFRSNRNPKLEPQYKVGIRTYIQYLKNPNPKFFNRSQFFYLIILSIFGMTLHVIFFFLALETLGAAVSMIGFPIGILMIAIYVSATGEEEVTAFKILYISLLLVVIWIFFFVYSEQSKISGMESTFTFMEFLYAPLFGVFLGVFYIGSEKDRYHTPELKFIRHNPDYKIIRMIFKVATFMIITSVGTVPIVWILSLFESTETVNTACVQFFEDFSRYGDLLIDPDFLLISLGSTFIAYVLYFYLEGTWDQTSLPFENWVSILGLLEPVFSLIFGVWLLGEEFMELGFVMIIVLTAAAIIMRYIDETENKQIVLILIKYRKGKLRDYFRALFELRDCQAVHTALGNYDFIMEVKVSSQKRMYKLTKQKIPDIFEGELEDMQVIYIQKTVLDKTIK